MFGSKTWWIHPFLHLQKGCFTEVRGRAQKCKVSPKKSRISSLIKVKVQTFFLHEHGPSSRFIHHVAELKTNRELKATDDSTLEQMLRCRFKPLRCLSARLYLLHFGDVPDEGGIAGKVVQLLQLAEVLHVILPDDLRQTAEKKTVGLHILDCERRTAGGRVLRS